MAQDLLICTIEYLNIKFFTAKKKGRPMRILLVCDHPAHATMLEQVLHKYGYHTSSTIRPDHDLVSSAQNTRSEMIIITVDSPSTIILENLRRLDIKRPIPVILFTKDQDDQKIRAAMDANVSSYIVDGFNGERLKSIIDVAVTRFEMLQKLKSTLKTVELRLQERKLIERAKGMVMKQRGCSEEEAYRLLRTTAMNHNKGIGEVAQALITANELIPYQK